MERVLVCCEKFIYYYSLILVKLLFFTDIIYAQANRSITCIENGRFYRNPNAQISLRQRWSLEECSKYYLCLDGETFHFQCSSGLAFDFDKQTCEPSEKVENCDKFTNETRNNYNIKHQQNQQQSPPTKQTMIKCENPRHYLCQDNKTCIPIDFICDGSLDCPNGEDEFLCRKNVSFMPDCNLSRCRLPECYCSRNGTDIPGNLQPNEVPQMIILTFDGSINKNNMDLYNYFFDGKYINPNNCPIPATFFVTHEYNNYFYTTKLWNMGNEIAINSVTNRSPEEWWSDNATIEDWFDEMIGQANIINKFSDIKLSEIKGLRVPYLRLGWNRQYLMMKEFGFLYDSSIVAPYSRIPLWPYTLDYKLPHKCFRQLCPTKSHPGIWELVINQLEAIDVSCATLDSCPSDLSGQDILDILIRNFNRYYSTNKAPFGIHLQSNWLENDDYLAAFEVRGNCPRIIITTGSMINIFQQTFLEHLLTKPDVWFVTSSQAIDWIQHPTPLKKLLKFKPWHCRKELIQTCETPKTCYLYHENIQKKIEMQICSSNKSISNNCPSRYPWIKNEFGAN